MTSEIIEGWGWGEDTLIEGGGVPVSKYWVEQRKGATLSDIHVQMFRFCRLAVHGLVSLPDSNLGGKYKQGNIFWHEPVHNEAKSADL